MATKEEEYKKLRAFLNKNIRGTNTDSLLKSLAHGPVHLIDNVEAVNDSLYIVSAKDKYLDQRLGDKGVTRPSEVGLSDEVFREIGIEITNRKQVRDLVHQLLRILYGDIFTRATSSASDESENFSLSDGDNLLLSFDGQAPIELIFSASQFSNINSATAQEVADAITKSIRKLGVSGAAFVVEDGSDFRVTLISPTDGPSSSVQVLGGSAQNALKFDEIRPTGGDATTQWTLTQETGGNIRATWSGGADPSLGRVRVGDYTTIYGTAFDLVNRGSFSIVKVQGGTVNNAYIEYENPNGISTGTCTGGLGGETNPTTCDTNGGTWNVGGIAQGTAEAILFFNPKVRTLISNDRYAAAFQTSPRTLEIFMPATTKVVRRNRDGAAHIHSQITEEVQLTLPASGSILSGHSFKISSYTDNFYVWYNKDGAGGNPSLPGIKQIEVPITGGDDNLTVCSKTSDILNSISYFTSIDNGDGTINVISNEGGDSTDTSNVDMGGSFNINIITQGTAEASETGQEGPYIYDTTVGYTIGDQEAVTTEILNISSDSILFVDDSSDFPDSDGKLIIGFGTSHQEGPVPYISTPSGTTLRINPSYKFKNEHPIGTDIALIAQESPASPQKDGTDKPFYLTDSVAGRIYAEQIINEITATGIVVVVYILFPSDIGLGKGGDPINSEKFYVWGTEEDL